MSLLYGDNGTGKTTILNLIFHLLSSDQRRGHKTRMANVPFRSFNVTFSDHTTVFASRTLDSLTGTFDLGLRYRGGSAETLRMEVDPESGTLPARQAPPELEPFLRKISGVVPAVFYLGDDRTLESDILPADDRRTLRGRFPPQFRQGERLDPDHELNEPREVVLQDSIRRTAQQLYVELAQASTRGESDARHIYAEILRSIVSASVSPDMQSGEKAHLERDLQELERISTEFATFHLGAAIDAAPLSESLSNADEVTFPIVVQVLRSFLDGQRARLDALETLYNKMRNFVTTTNEYLTDKQVALDITEGLTIRIPGGQLDPAFLSSGEQHLLLLFLNFFASSDRSRLFIIDEPELSLNVKWQRELVGSLLELSNARNYVPVK